MRHACTLDADFSLFFCTKAENPSSLTCVEGPEVKCQNNRLPVYYETLRQHADHFMDLCLAVKVPLLVMC